MSNLQKLNATTYKLVAKSVESEKERKENTIKIIVPKDASKQVDRLIRKIDKLIA